MSRLPPAEVLQQVEYLESTSRKLGEFLDKVRAVEAPLSRCEERLESALGAPPAAARDAVARLLDHVHGLRAPLQVSFYTVIMWVDLRYVFNYNYILSY